jgi:L-ascorbate metabolism protein UlaG (beta-lactamase superfamily)
MKITKFVHSCLLVEMPEPVNRTALFDPGVMSEQALSVDKLMYLDDIFITHEHSDHFSPKLVQQLVQKFPDVRIAATQTVVQKLQEAGIKASSDLPEGATAFDAPHEDLSPIGAPPANIGVNYLETLTHPGDSHHFAATMPILALPVTAPWGSLVKAINLALELKPQHILPIHDWHWSDAARQASYDQLESIFSKSNITFHKLVTGEPVVINP